MAKVKRDDLTHFIDEDIHIPTRTVYIGSTSGDEADGDEHGINYAVSERAIKNLHILEWAAPNGDQPINVILNTPGGSVEHGMAIYDAIRMCKNHVTVTAFQACSMGSIILQAGDDRIMTPNAVMMIHYGNSTYNDHNKNIEKWVEYYKKFDSDMIELFLSKIREVKPDATYGKFANSINFDKILRAEEALELNLIDGILQYDGTITRKEKGE